MKIWSDKQFLRSLSDVRPILMPFWGCIKREEPHRDRFDSWVEKGPSVFTLVDNLKDAEVVIYPQDPTIDPQGFQKFQTLTGTKKMLVFFNSDSQEPISIRENGILFRTSAIRSKKQLYEFGLPGWSEDWGFLGERQFEEKPIVGFCGQDFRPNVRSISLNILEKSPLIKTNFIRKKEFWGGWLSQGRKPNHGKTLRNEFINNMKESDYVLCARGGGNFSYRLYETMMSGRIPILVNTDCLLPYDFIVDWSKEFPIIDEKDISDIDKVLIFFHNKLGASFKDHQFHIREMWKKWISPVGFFTNLSKHFEGLNE